MGAVSQNIAENAAAARESRVRRKQLPVGEATQAGAGGGAAADHAAKTEGALPLHGESRTALVSLSPLPGE